VGIGVLMLLFLFWGHTLYQHSSVLYYTFDVLLSFFLLPTTLLQSRGE
jgi:hypothetical protein